MCVDWEKTMNHIISECSKLELRENTSKYNWVGKVIHLELCKKFKFDQADKHYMHNLESVLENDIYKILWDFEIQTDHQISVRRTDLVIEDEKQNLLNCGLCNPGRPQEEGEEEYKYLDIGNW